MWGVGFRLCEVPVTPRGLASVLAAALPPCRPACPGLLTTQKETRVSSGNSESPRRLQGLATPVPTAHQGLVQSHRLILFPVL